MCKSRTTITLAPHIKEFASKEATSLGLDFSAYVTVLIANRMGISPLLTTQNIPPVNNTSVDSAEVESKGIEKPFSLDTGQENELDRILGM